jgi:signal transduction histidine kinase
LLRTIRARLYGLVGAALAAFVALSVYAATVAWRARRDAELTANLGAARSAAATLRTFVDDVLHQGAALGRAVADPRLDGDRRSRLLAEAAGEYAAVREFDWVATDGTIAASSNPSATGISLAGLDYLRRIADGADVAVSDLLPARLDGHPIVVVARAVRAPGGGALLGVIVAVVAPERLGGGALPVARRGDAALTVFDRAGRLVFGWPEMVLEWGAREPGAVPPLAREALAGREATGTVRRDDEEEQLGAAVPVEGLGWAVQASRSKTEAMGPLRRELLLVIGAGVLLSVLTLVASGAVGAKTVAGLRRLERRALALARGERLPAGRREPDEIAHLGAAYDRMAADLLAEQERFRAVFDAAPAGIVVLDAETLEASWANRAYLAFLDEPFRSAGIEGQPLEAFLPGAAEHGMADVLRRVAAGEEVSEAEVRYDGFARGPTWWRWAVRALPGAGGRRELVLLASEVTEQVVARQQSEAERRRLEALLQTLPAGVFIADARGQLVQANDEARRIWGGRAPLRSAVHRPYRGRRVDTGAALEAGDWPTRRALASGQPVTPYLVEIDRFDGAKATILTGAMPTRDASGAVNGAVSTLLDVTELRCAVRRRDEVLRVVSHDLRTPLATVTLGAAALIRLSDSPDARNAPDAAAQMRRAAGRIGAAGKRMMRLIEDLLDMASLDRGQLSIRPVPVDPADLIGAAADELRGVAEERGLDLCLSVSPGLPQVACDRDRILQVLGNVAGNAVKATERGAICLAAEAFGEAVVFRVRDTGPGIAAADLPHVFDRYHRGADAAWPGTGLGLAISRALVEAHGGTIWAESEPGEGTVVTFTLPVPPPGALAQAAGA